MAVKTREEYVESLRKQKPKVFMAGERVENLVDHPMFQGTMSVIGAAYACAHEPKYKELATVDSPLTNERISRWNHIVQDEHDALAKVRLLRQMGDYFSPCTYRCITVDMINAGWVTSYEIDRKYGTDYHQRFINIVKDIQRNDWTLGGTLIDPKGDRGLRPSQQSDPDMYLHIVDRRSDGIVVRGAKAHSSCAPVTNVIMAAPMSRPLNENEKDYAVGFITPVDTEGITYICRTPPPRSGPSNVEENPYGSRFSAPVEAMAVFDDVFIPWERVFMAGEHEFVGLLINVMTAFHMMSKCACRPSSMDLNIGATALAAEVNGTERAHHIREYLTDMISNAELTYACGLASAVDGEKHVSGVYIPKSLPACIGKVFAAKKLGENRYYMQETAGGLVATMASEEDYRNPETASYIEKYYKGKEGVPTENRIRAMRLIEDLTGSTSAGWYHAMAITGGGTPGMLRPATLLDYDLEAAKTRAKKVAGIKD